MKRCVDLVKPISRIFFAKILLSFLLLPFCFASDLVPYRTGSTGYQPQFQLSGNRIFYVWHEYDGPFRQIFTAVMNADGTGWRAEKRTSGPFDKVFPQLHAAGNKIYYVRQQPDSTKNRQIWTMEMDVDGTGWKEVQRTDTPYDKQFPQLQVIGEKIYYAWNEFDGKHRQIWTAEMNLNGTGWNAVKRTATPYDKFEPQLFAAGDKIHYVWRESDGAHFQVWTAVADRNGSGWQASKRTTSPSDKHNPQLQVDSDGIHFTWHEADGPNFQKARYQIWTGRTNPDGTGWQAVQRTFASFDKYTPQLQGVRDTIYYVWEESDGKHRQIWTGTAKRDGTGWQARKRTSTPFGKYDPQFQVVGNRVYYVWHEDHGQTEPIWVTAETLK